MFCSRYTDSRYLVLFQQWSHPTCANKVVFSQWNQPCFQICTNLKSHYACTHIPVKDMVICFICAKVYFTGHRGLELPCFFTDHGILQPIVLRGRTSIKFEWATRKKIYFLWKPRIWVDTCPCSLCTGFVPALSNSVLIYITVSAQLVVMWQFQSILLIC